MTLKTRPILWTVVYGVAFGWLEAAVVVYLRRIVYPGGFAFPLQPIDPPLLAVEMGREAATLVMLAAVGMLAGRTRWARFGAFCLAFGVWDIVFYLGLKAAVGWPPSLATWDILFLLPWPWVGPVYSPVAAAVLMSVGGALTMRLEARGAALRADRITWLLGGAGSLVLLFTWLRDLDAGLRGALPEGYPVGLFLAGWGLLLACTVRFLRSGRPQEAPRP